MNSLLNKSYINHFLLPILGISLALLQARADEITDYYQIIGSAPAEAEIFIIGETHTSNTDVEMENKIINSYGKQYDILLLEGGESLPHVMNGSQVGAELHFTSSRLYMRVGGWDSSKALKEVLKLIAGAVEIEDSTDANYWKIIQTVLYGIKNKPIFNFWHSVRNSVMRYRIQSISKLYYDDTKIFLIAGSSHVLDEISLLVDTLKSTGRPFSVLLPKKDNPNRKFQMTPIEYGRTLVAPRKAKPLF